MTAQQLIAFNLVLLAALASPGPAMVMAIRTNMGDGRRTGMALGTGLALMAATWTLMALVGLDWIFHLVPGLYLAMRIAGAAYLIFLAWKLWRHAQEPVAPSDRSVRHAFRDGILVNALNPKSILFAAAVLMAIFPSGLGAGEKLIITLNHFTVEWLFYMALALLLTTPAMAQGFLRAKPIIDRIAGVALAALALRLLVVS